MWFWILQIREEEIKTSENILEKQLIDIIKDKEMAEHLKLAKVDMLVKLGVNVNARDRWGKSAILYAKDDVKIRKVIINAVKKRNIKTSEKIGSNELDK